jgi:hypothetical protein
MLYDNALGMLSNVSGLDLGAIIGPDVLQAPASSTTTTAGDAGSAAGSGGSGAAQTLPGLDAPYEYGGGA